MDKQFSSPLCFSGCCRLVQGLGIFEEDINNNITKKKRGRKHISKHFFGIIDKKIPQENTHNPKNSDLRSCRRCVCPSFCQKCQSENIGSGQEKKSQEFSEIPPSKLDHSEKSEKIDRSIEKKAISLIEKISNECFEPEFPRDIKKQSLNKIYRFG